MAALREALSQAVEPQSASAQLAEVGGGLKETGQGSLGWETSYPKQTGMPVLNLSLRSPLVLFAVPARPLQRNCRCTSQRRALWAPVAETVSSSAAHTPMSQTPGSLEWEIQPEGNKWPLMHSGKSCLTGKAHSDSQAEAVCTISLLSKALGSAGGYTGQPSRELK